jgi:hypothetical protein
MAGFAIVAQNGADLAGEEGERLWRKRDRLLRKCYIGQRDTGSDKEGEVPQKNSRQ